MADQEEQQAEQSTQAEQSPLSTGESQVSAQKGETIQERAIELDQRWSALAEQIEQLLEQQRAQIRKNKRNLKLFASVLTIAGVLIGVVLIWGSSQTGGFWSLLMDGLGTGFLVTA